MKKIVYYIIGVTALLAVASCEKTPAFDEGSPKQGLMLNFTCVDAGTRAATVEGVSNENLIKRIDYFIFACDADGVVEDDAAPALSGVIEPSDGLLLSYTETISPEALADVFPDNNQKAVVFAVANFVDYYGAAVTSPQTVIPDSVKTWKGLHELEVGETFFKDGGAGFTLRWPRVMQPNDNKLFFVMVGEQVVELKTTGSYAIDAEVHLKRLASKVTVKFNYADYYDDDNGVRWYPQDEDEETRVFLSNAIEHTTLSGPLTRALVAEAKAKTTMPEGNGTRDIFEYAYDFMNDITTVDDSNNKIAHYYTYPISMEEGDDNQPYLKLVLPWYGYKNYPDDEGDHWLPYKQKEVYYKIVLPSNSINEPNMIYEFEVDVDIVGTDKEVNVTGEQYVVKGWSSDEAISSNVATGRYISLDIPKDEYDMYTELVEILYVSSGEVEISDLTIDQEDFYNNRVNHFITGVNPTTGGFNYGTGYNANTPDSATPTPNRLSNWVSISGNHLVIRHQMNNNFSANQFDVAPMVFTVTLHLKGESDTSFDRTVTVTQYPALYATRDEHIGRVYVNRQTNTANNSNTYVQATDDNGGNLGSIQAQGANGLPGGANSNPNNYTVYVSTLSGFSQPWVIGDPRDTPSTISGLGVTQYRKARADASLTIAPAFKIASSYGQIRTNVPTFTQATNRCAAYQENGYPAGRWRVPTEAEIEFCVELSNKEMIPSLFNYSYWASSGRYYDYQTGWHDGSGTHAVRCVYDVWFWGEGKSADCTDDGGTTYNKWGGYHD